MNELTNERESRLGPWRWEQLSLSSGLTIWQLFREWEGREVMAAEGKAKNWREAYKEMTRLMMRFEGGYVERPGD